MKRVNTNDVVIPAVAKRYETVVAAGSNLKGHPIDGYFRCKDPDEKLVIGNLEYVSATKEE